MKANRTFTSQRIQVVAHIAETYAMNLICVWNATLHSMLSLHTNDRCGRPIISWSVR
jgi:hypothetical protein